MPIGNNIVKYREQQGLSQKELAAKLGVTPTCLNYYEKNKRSPDVETIKKIAVILNVSSNLLIGLPDFEQSHNTLTSTEQTHINKYRQLDKYGKNVVDTVIEKEHERIIEQQHNEKQLKTQINIIDDAELSDDEPETLQIPYYDDKAAAGNGYMFNDNGYELLTVIKNRNTERADFVVTVSGDSMEPDYSDSDKVLVHSQPDIYEGEIGIFIINNSGYIKKKGAQCLISLNKKYKDIYVGEYDTFRCAGKVIAKLEEEDIIYT